MQNLDSNTGAANQNETTNDHTPITASAHSYGKLDNSQFTEAIQKLMAKVRQKEAGQDGRKNSIYSSNLPQVEPIGNKLPITMTPPSLGFSASQVVAQAATKKSQLNIGLLHQLRNNLLSKVDKTSALTSTKNSPEQRPFDFNQKVS